MGGGEWHLPATVGVGRLRRAAAASCSRRRAVPNERAVLAAAGGKRARPSRVSDDGRRRVAPIASLTNGRGKGDPLWRPGVHHLGRPGVPAGGRPPSPPMANRVGRRATTQWVGRCRGLGERAGARATASCGGTCTAASSRRHSLHKWAVAADAEWATAMAARPPRVGAVPAPTELLGRSHPSLPHS